MTSLIFWGFLNLLARARPDVIGYISIEGYSNTYIIDINVNESECRNIVECINNTYKNVYSEILARIKNREGNAYRAWFAAFRGSAPSFLKVQIADTIDVSVYLSNILNPHVCTGNLKKPHVTISGSIGKWFWSTGSIGSRVKALESCDVCRSLAIVGLEYESIVIRSRTQGLIITIGFEGILHEEETFTLSSLLSSTSPWTKIISNRITPRILDRIPATTLPLIISTYLPTDLPLTINWYIMCNIIGTGRTLEYGSYRLNEYIDFMNHIKAMWPYLPTLINILIKALNRDELMTDAITLLSLLSECAQIRRPMYTYMIMREITSFIERVKKLNLERHLNLSRLKDMNKCAIALGTCLLE